MAQPLGCVCLASRTTSTRLGADCSRSHLASASSNLRKNSPSESDIPSSRVRTRPPSMTTAQRQPQPATPRELLSEWLLSCWRTCRPPAALGGHEFGDWPPEYIANGFGGDLDARHRHHHTRYARPP